MSKADRPSYVVVIGVIAFVLGAPLLLALLKRWLKQQPIPDGLIFAGALGIALFGGITLYSLVTGRVPRGKGGYITREEHPKSFWRNIYVGIVAMSIFAAFEVYGFIAYFFPQFR